MHVADAKIVRASHPILSVGWTFKVLLIVCSATRPHVSAKLVRAASEGVCRDPYGELVGTDISISAPIAAIRIAEPNTWT